jgi:DNA-binding NarL/FixJ family response regulator
MPRLNGIDATRQIKSRHPGVSVLILTAYDDDQYISAVLEAGAAGYLLKDVKGSELADAVLRIHSGEAVLHPVVARKVLQRFTESRGETPSLGRLTERELEVLRFAATGLGNKEIGHSLDLSSRTVQVHLAHIFEKLGVASRTEAVIYGLRHGLLKLEDLG